MISEALVTRLEGFAGLAALVADRIYVSVLPQNPTYPAITYQRISGPRVENLQSHSGLAHPRFQFSCFARTAAEAVAVREQVRLALEGFRGIIGSDNIQGIEIVDERGFFEKVLQIYRSDIDAVVWHLEAIAS